jgi:hypothetical protein
MGETNCEKRESCCFFIGQHRVPLIIFRHYENNLMLLKPIETPFATNFLMVERLLKLRLAIEQTIVNHD